MVRMGSPHKHKIVLKDVLRKVPGFGMETELPIPCVVVSHIFTPKSLFLSREKYGLLVYTYNV